MSAVLEHSEPLSYELLLRKSHEASPAYADAAEVASTAEPRSSSTSTAGSDNVCIPSRNRVQLLRNVSISGAHADPRVADLISQTRDLSDKVFDEDCLLDVTKKSGWKLSLLVSDDLAVLCGFVVAKVTNGALSIAKLAVPSEFRGSGFGKFIMEEMMKLAKKQGDVHEVCLSSLPTAVTFYQRLGFKALRGFKFQPGDDLVEGQVYMVKKLGPRRK